MRPLMILICLVGGSFMYPAYMSFKSLEAQDAKEDRMWLTYWVVYGCFGLIEGESTKYSYSYSLIKPLQGFSNTFCSGFHFTTLSSSVSSASCSFHRPRCDVCVFDMLMH